jgi:hypothetical protein
VGKGVGVGALPDEAGGQGNALEVGVELPPPVVVEPQAPSKIGKATRVMPKSKLTIAFCQRVCALLKSIKTSSVNHRADLTTVV